MAVREEQIMLCHEMLDNLLGRNIALCDAGVGIGKTYAYLVACVLMRKYWSLAQRLCTYSNAWRKPDRSGNSRTLTLVCCKKRI